MAPQTPEAGVVAYDKVTGALKWKSAPLSGIPGYVTPSIVKVAGEDHLVMITGAAGRGRNAKGGSVNGLDPRSGKVLWTYSDWQCIIPVPSAVDAGEGRLLITGAYSAGISDDQGRQKGTTPTPSPSFSRILILARTRSHPFSMAGTFTPITRSMSGATASLR